MGQATQTYSCVDQEDLFVYNCCYRQEKKEDFQLLNQGSSHMEPLT
jgi:hypothetical protein